KKQQIMDQVKSELALANAQELVNKMGDKCFNKCITKPGARLDSSEQTCLAKCMDRYMEAWNIVSKSYIGRAQREAGGS
ncbi:Tim10/DDP family zinc finger protein, partial [Paraphysoderma sedebokerense]